MSESSRCKNERKCPWCGKVAFLEVMLVKKRSGDVRETRCANCGKVLAAYLVEEGDFMSGIRAFPNQ